MSLIISVYVGEGIVLAGDSRITYNTTKASVDGGVTQFLGVHTNNSTEKVFICPNGNGIAVCGDASIGAQPITGYIQSFIREHISECTDVKAVPQMLIDYFVAMDNPPNTNFIVAGYEKTNTSTIPRVYSVYIATRQSCERTVEGQQGATWDGETVILTKLIQQLFIKNESNEYVDLGKPEIAWNFFTLQDAVDFAKYAVETTINTMHFYMGMETVGYPIDILVIKPDKSFWSSKKSLIIQEDTANA
jgi:hypothetical protein